MTPEQEYLEAQKTLKENYEKASKILGVEYAKSQRKFQIGDILERNGTIIRLDSFTWNYAYPTNVPQPIYKGSVLTKKLELVKKGEKNYNFHGNEGITLLKEK